MMSDRELINNIRREIEDEEKGDLLIQLYTDNFTEVFHMSSDNYNYLEYVCEDCNLEMITYNR